MTTFNADKLEKIIKRRKTSHLLLGEIIAK